MPIVAVMSVMPITRRVVIGFPTALPDIRRRTRCHRPSARAVHEIAAARFRDVTLRQSRCGEEGQRRHSDHRFAADAYSTARANHFESSRRGLSALAGDLHLRRPRLSGRAAARAVHPRLERYTRHFRPRALVCAAVARDAAPSPARKSAPNRLRAPSAANGNSQASGWPPSGGPVFQRVAFRGLRPYVWNAAKHGPFPQFCRDWPCGTLRDSRR